MRPSAQQFALAFVRNRNPPATRKSCFVSRVTDASLPFVQSYREPRMSECPSILAMIVADYLALATQDVLIGRQPRQTHRATSMQFAGTDPNLSSESISVSVGEPRRRVVIDAGCIHFPKKPLGCGLVGRDNRLRVSGAKAMHMVNRVVDVADDSNCKDQVPVFLVPFAVRH